MVSRPDTGFLPEDLCGGGMAPKPRLCPSCNSSKDGGQTLDGVGAHKAISNCEPQSFGTTHLFHLSLSLFEYPA